MAAGGGAPTVDPRLLAFEVSTGFVLRPQQVALVRSLVKSAKEGASSCHQMLMGEGKTTVVCPMLALVLGDGKLVMQVVPAALLAFALSVLRGAFGGGGLRKAVWTFKFERRTPMTAELLAKGQLAAREGGVMLSTPAAVKAFMLKLVELLHLLDAGQYSRNRSGLVSAATRRVRRLLRRQRSTSAAGGGGDGLIDKGALHAQAAWAVSLLGVWRASLAVVDEVDLVFHPLRSELNWPLGDRLHLDFAPTRWALPMHMLAAFLAAAAATSADPPPDAKGKGREAEAEAALRAAVVEGLRTKVLQSTPHVVVLEAAYYHSALRPALAELLLLWLRRQGLRDAADDVILKSLAAGGAGAALAEALPDAHVKLINLGAAWLTSLLPHVLAKIDRVHYGLLKPGEIEKFSEMGSLPRSRRFLAVPFVGKDAPSQASEFAHPDVAIGFSYLAYSYEGLRADDFGRCLRALREALEGELGPELARPSALMWADWVKAAGRRVRGASRRRVSTAVRAAASAAAAVAAAAASGGESLSYESLLVGGEIGGLDEVLPLHLVDPNDAEYVGLLHDLLRLIPAVVRYYLDAVVLPDTTAHQPSKLSASGQDLGGEMLFGVRIGFSGTPSSLLPLEMGECQWAKGDDAKMLRTLTAPEIVSVRKLPDDWSVRSLLERLAAMEPLPSALIDAGALVTGLTNEEVAAALIPLLPASAIDGVVFLEAGGKKRILLRAGHAMDLERCGVPKERRFAFFDQVHTTGRTSRSRRRASPSSRSDRGSRSATTHRRRTGCAGSARGRRSFCL